MTIPANSSASQLVRRTHPCDPDLSIIDGFRADLVVEERLIIEVKSVERAAPVHAKQLLTYLRLTKQPLGLLMNFGCGTFREGVKRVQNGPSGYTPPT